MEALTAKPREIVEGRDVGDEPLSGRQSGGFPRGGMARSSSPRLRQSDHDEPGWKRRSRSPKSKRSHHPGDVPGSVAIRQPGGSRRHSHAASQSSRDGGSRPELAECQTPRADKSPECLTDSHRRERQSRPDRAEDDEVAKLAVKGKSQQIGVRRREASGEVTRDATPKGERKQQPRLREEREESEVPGASGDHPSHRRRRKRRSSRAAKGQPSEERNVVAKEEKKEERREAPVSRGSSPKGIVPRATEESNPSPIRQDSPASSLRNDDFDEVLCSFRRWIKDNPMDGLSVAQSGVHLLLQIQESPTGLGKYLRRMLSEPSSEVVDERQRSLLPLPLKKDVAEAVRSMMEKREYRRLAGTWKDKRAAGTSKVQREMRKQGLMAWHFAVTLGLNYLWSGCRSGGRVCHRKPSRAQELCQERIWQAVRHFVDDMSEVKEKLVKAPERTLWEGKLDGVKISYQGEIVEKAQPLTLDQIISGLPPPGFGGKVALADLCEGETRRLLLNPEETLLSGEDLPQEIPKPRVLASDQEWDLIGKELYDRGLVRPVARCAAVGEQKILNGAFGVLKPGKLSPNGAPVLRLIMDFRAVNSVMRVIEGDVRTLVGERWVLYQRL